MTEADEPQRDGGAERLRRQLRHPRGSKRVKLDRLRTQAESLDAETRELRAELNVDADAHRAERANSRNVMPSMKPAGCRNRSRPRGRQSDGQKPQATTEGTHTNT